MAISSSVYYLNYGNGSSTGYFATSVWATGTALAGNRRRPTAPAVGNERIFVCTTGGTNTTQPTWPTTAGAKATDGSTAVTWYEVSGQPGLNGDLTNCPVWAQSQSVAVGTVIYVASNGTLQIATQASGGTTGSGSAPAFSATAGNTVSDSTVTWTSLGAASNYAAWSTPLARLQTAVSAGWAPMGGTIYVASAHTETQGSAMTVSPQVQNAAPLVSVLSVDASLSLPPTAASLLAGASIATTSGAVTLISGLYMYGVTASAFATLNIAGSSGLSRFENCSLGMTGTTGTNRIVLCVQASGVNNTTLEFINTSVFFGHVAQGIFPTNATLRWTNSTAVTGAILPTTLFSAATNKWDMTCVGVDFSNLTGTLIAAQFATSQQYLVNCKINASATVAAAPPSYSSVYTDLICSDSSGTNYNFGRWRYQGTLAPDTAIVATGGASNGTTQYSYKITTTANSTWISPFEAIPITIWNVTAGSTVTATVHGVWNATSLPNNDQVWMAVEYLGAATSPLASLASGTIATILSTPAAQTASTTAWDGLVAARQNSHAYILGDTIKVSDNVGRIFFCTTAGTTAGSEPGSYAGATDGGNVTDGTAVFRAGVRFQIAVAMSSPTPGMAGYLQAFIRVALPSTTVWIDPLITLA